MRVLLDHCVPADLSGHIRGHEVLTSEQLGWHGLDDGPLLDAAADQFDVLVTVDSSIPYQQLILGRKIAVIVLRAPSNRTAHLARLIPEIHRLLNVVADGEVRLIST